MRVFAAVLFTFLAALPAFAQADMTCAQLLQSNKQIDEAMKGQPKDAESAAMDKKVNDYCVKNPNAKASEAMEKAMAD